MEARRTRVGHFMPRIRPTNLSTRRKQKLAAAARKLRRPGRKLSRPRRPSTIESAEIAGMRAEAEAVKQRGASFRLLFDGNPVPMIVCALDAAHIIAANDAAIEHYGYSRAEFEKLNLRNLQAFDSEPPWAGESPSDEQAARTWKHIKADGALIDVAIYSRELIYNEQPATLLVLIDITERKRAEARLAFLAQHDGLTGLPNRDLLRQQMDDVLAYTRRSQEKVAVLALGLDNFKAVNDTFGPALGD